MPRKSDIPCRHLLALIGQQVHYHQHHCQVIELLDGCELVLQVLEEHISIQATQYGEGHRAVPVTFTLPVFDGEGNFHPDLEASGLHRLLSQYLPNL